MLRMPCRRWMPALQSLLLSMAVLLSAARAQSAAKSPETAQARAILEAAGTQGGIVVHLGCGDGKVTATLAQAVPQGRSSGWIVRKR